MEPSLAFAQACLRTTAGNPFLLAEALRAVRADGIDPDRQAIAALDELGPESVARQVLVRLGRFGTDAITIARAVAVFGGSPQLVRVASSAGLGEQRARELCDRLPRRRSSPRVSRSTSSIPWSVKAIYRDLVKGERSETHRRAAEIMSSTGAGAREIAPHLLACAPNGDQWVVARLGEAAWEAIQAAAFDAAQVYLERALEERPEEEEPLLYALGRCMLQTNPVRASEILSELAERTPDETLRLRALRYAANG